MLTKKGSLLVLGVTVWYLLDRYRARVSIEDQPSYPKRDSSADVIDLAAWKAGRQAAS